MVTLLEVQKSKCLGYREMGLCWDIDWWKWTYVYIIMPEFNIWQDAQTYKRLFTIVFMILNHRYEFYIQNPDIKIMTFLILQNIQTFDIDIEIL